MLRRWFDVNMTRNSDVKRNAICKLRTGNQGNVNQTPRSNCFHLGRSGEVNDLQCIELLMYTTPLVHRYALPLQAFLFTLARRKHNIYASETSSVSSSIMTPLSRNLTVPCCASMMQMKCVHSFMTGYARSQLFSVPSLTLAHPFDATSS